MASEWFWITGTPGRRFEYAVERLSDGASYRRAAQFWQIPAEKSVYSRMAEALPGRFGAELPELEAGLDYCVHIVDVDTGQLVVSQSIDGRGRVPTPPETRTDLHVGSVENPTQPVPGLGDIAVGIGRLATHWIAQFRIGRFYGGLGIGAACVVAAFLLWTRGPSREDIERARVLVEQRAIREVISRDKVLAQQIAQKIGFMDQYWDGSSLVAEYAAGMDAIDLGGCPEDFQLAFKRHVAAWAALARVKASNEGINGAVKGFFTYGFSIPSAMSELDRAMKEVHASWSEVQQAAIRHGVAP